MRSIPPSTTTATRAAEARPAHIGATPWLAWRISASWFAWNIARQPTSPQTEKNTAIQRQRGPRPTSMKYIGPPCGTPFSSFLRYMAASVQVKNLVDMPTIAVTHIQNIAPAPPWVMAIATPAMLPTPTVAERAVVRA